MSQDAGQWFEELRNALIDLGWSTGDAVDFAEDMTPWFMDKIDAAVAEAIKARDAILAGERRSYGVIHDLMEQAEAKVEQQAEAVKERDAEIARLKDERAEHITRSEEWARMLTRKDGKILDLQDALAEARREERERICKYLERDDHHMGVYFAKTLRASSPPASAPEPKRRYVGPPTGWVDVDPASAPKRVIKTVVLHRKSYDYTEPSAPEGEKT